MPFLRRSRNGVISTRLLLASGQPWSAWYMSGSVFTWVARQLDTRTRLLGTMSGINLLYPVMVALVILMPLRPRGIALGLLLVALFGIGSSISIAVTEARKPEGQTRQLLFYRYFVPLLASSALAVGALALLAGQPWSIYLPPVFAFVMIAIGCDNAWDLLLSRYGKRSFIDLKTPPAPPG